MAWPKAKLVDCVDLIPGFAFKSQYFSRNAGDVPLVKGENVGQGRVLWEIAKRWPTADLDKMTKFHLVPGDVVVAMDRPWVPAGLKWAFIRSGDPKALLVQRVARLRANSKKLDQTFLRFVIGGPAFENHVRPITTGVNVPHISGRQILDFKFDLPPLSAQCRIAAILSAYDELIENHQRRIKILEAMVHTMYRQHFPSGLGSTNFGCLNDLIFVGRESVNPFEFPEEEFDSFSIPAFDRGRVPVVEFGKSILSGKYCIDDTCVLLSKLNPRIPRIWLPAPSGKRRAITSTEFLVLKPKAGITREFIYAKCCSDDFTKSFASMAIGTSTSHQRVKPDSLLAMPCVLPDRAAVTNFSQLVSPMLGLIQCLRDQAYNLRQTRDLLLPCLLSGRIAIA